MLAAVRRSLSFLSPRQRGIYFALVIARALSAIFDLIGIALIGVIAAYAATRVDGGANAPDTVLGIPVPDGLESNLFFIVLTALGVFLLKAIIAIALSRTLVYFIARREVENAQRIVEHLLRGSLDGVRRYSKAELQYAATGATTAAFTGILNNVATLFSEGFLLLAIAVTFFVINPVAAIAAVAYFALLVLLIQTFVGRRLRLAGNEAADGTVETSGILSDSVDTFREIYVLGRQRYFITILRTARAKLARSSATYAFYAAMPRYVIETGLILGVVVFAGILVLNGSVASGLVTLGVFLTGGVRIMASLLPLQTAAAAIKITTEQAKSAHALLEAARGETSLLDTAPADPRGSSRAATPALPVTISGVGFRYPGTSGDAIDKVTLTIAAGSYAALIGPSGAGKTTLVDLLLGLLLPQRGTVKIGGLAPAELREKSPGVLSYVPQKPGMVSGTIAQNIALGIAREEVDQVLLDRVIDEAFLRELVDSLPDGSETLVGKQADGFSGGQIQRIGLARALYAQPRVLILDEATSGLDASSEAFIGKTLAALHGEVTVLVIAHRLSAVQHADTVFVMEAGKLTAAGEFSELRRTVPMVAEYVKLMSFEEQ
jgi:ABC-type multidrug transport system fused ATPase/permease subunit